MDDETIKQMPFDELKTLHRKIGAQLAEKKHEKLEEMRHQIATLGFTAAELAPPKTKAASRSAAKYRNPETGEIWGRKRTQARSGSKTPSKEDEN